MTELTASERLRIVLVDDHQMFRDGVRRLIDAEPDLLVVGEAGSGDEAIALALQHEPEILLLDVALRDGSGMPVIERIRAASRATRVIVVTAAIADSALLRAFQLGTHGVVLKTAGATALLQGIRSVHSGEYVVGRDVMTEFMAAIRGFNDPARGAVIAIPPRAFGLTIRERQIVSAVVDAAPNKTIAEKFAISEKTVKHHLTNIFNKVGVSSRLELAMFA